MSRMARILGRALEFAELQGPRSTPAPPEAVALAALVAACLRDPTLSWRAREAGSLDEILDCLAADRLIMRAELPVDPAVLRGADTADVLRAVLDRALRSRA